MSGTPISTDEIRLLESLAKWPYYTKLSSAYDERYTRLESLGFVSYDSHSHGVEVRITIKGLDELNRLLSNPNY